VGGARVRAWEAGFKVLTLRGNRGARFRHLFSETLLLSVLYPWILLTVRRERRRKRETPRVFWGTIPLISIKYHQQALGLYGYDSVSVVDELYFLTARTDFDHTSWELLDESRLGKRLPMGLKRRIVSYYTFLWALQRCDIFVFYASSMILRYTRLKYSELSLLHRAGKKVVMIAYGGDVQVAHRARNLLYKHALAQDYPEYVRDEKRTLAELEYLSQHADHIVSGVDWVDYMPWWDRINVGHFAIDMSRWQPLPTRQRRDRVVILHAPNHREIKGTRFLIRACEELAAEGVPIELELLERVPNTKIHERMAYADIVADQFIIGWYAMFAIEAMSMGKPVLCYLRPDLLRLHSLYATAKDCPLVNTPPLRIKDVLRELVADPERREELGRRGREYVEANHSLEAVGAMFDAIFRGFGMPPREAEVRA
jgi:glycosyltransferase involved in cell wall biosynthesis